MLARIRPWSSTGTFRSSILPFSLCRRLCVHSHIGTRSNKKRRFFPTTLGRISLVNLVFLGVSSISVVSSTTLRRDSTSSMVPPSTSSYYRADGVRITHDPYAAGMSTKYGEQGDTDPEGFDPYADSVGPGIYGGYVKRDANNNVVTGKQYQNHNPTPGPVYAGGGYTEMSKAISAGGGPALQALVARDAAIVHEITTGGATPLHMCGMSQRGQKATRQLIDAGADVEALDTYGYTPLMRMASNNLAEGARELLIAGAEAGRMASSTGETAMSIARASRAREVMAVLKDYA